MPHRDLSPDDCRAALASEQGLRVLDVRTEPEFAAYHIAGSLLIPVEELASRLGELDPANSYVVTCEHGVRSVAACEFLDRAGFADLRNLVGGMARWIGEGHPTET